MANNDEQKKNEQEQKKAQDDAMQQSNQEAARLDQNAGNSELTASGQKRVEVVKATAPTPETVSNDLEEGKGYYVGGVLVDPNGDPVK